MENVKKQPERTCAVCRKKAGKDQFIRIVKSDGKVFIDKTYKANGRGMYICGNSECIAKAIKTKAVNRAFKKEIPDEIYEELKSLEKSN